MPNQFTDKTLNLFREYTRQMGHLGTFNLENDRLGNPVIRVGHRVFQDPREAIEYRERTRIKSFATIQHGSPIHQRPAMGAGHYGRLEGLLDQMAMIDPEFRGATLERSSFATSKGMTQNVLKALSDETTGVFTGFLHPGKNELNVLRVMKSNGEYVDEHKLINVISQVLKLKDPAEAGYDKLYKRLNSFLNMEEYGEYLPGGKGLRVKAFDATQMSAYQGMSKGAFDAGWDGQTLGNANVLKTHAKTMRERASQIERQFAKGDKSPEAIEAFKKAEALRDKAREFIKISKTGGRLQDFRALGLVDTETMKEIDAMIKGDILFLPSKKFAQVAVDEFGMDEKIARLTDVITEQGNLKKELAQRPIAGRAMGSISLRPTHAQGVVRFDIQAIMAQGRALGDPIQLARHTLGQYQTAIDRFMKTGELPASYVESLQDIINKTQPDKITSTLLGDNVRAVENLKEQKARARAILARAESGMPPTPEFVNEVLNGIQRSMFHRKQSTNFIMPGAVRAHMGSAHINRFMDEGAIDLPDFKVSFTERGGWAMNAQTLADIRHLTGGSDLDDALAGHLRYIRETDSFKLIGVRSPTTRGENVLLDIDLKNANQDLVEVMARGDERYRDEIKQLRKARRTISSVEEAHQQLADTEAKIQNLRSSANVQQRQNRKLLDQLSRKRRGLLSTIDRGDLRVASLGMTMDDINARYYQMAIEMATESTAEELEVFGRYRVYKGERFPVKSPGQMSYENWAKKKARQTGIDLQTFEGQLRQGLSLENPNLPSGWASMAPHNRQAVLRSLANEGLEQFGGLGGVVNIDMLANSMLPQLDQQIELLKSQGDMAGARKLMGLIPYTDMERLVDVLIQGESLDQRGIGGAFDDIIARRNAMIDGIAEAVALHDIKLPQLYMEERGSGLYSELETAIKKYNPTFFDGGRTMKDAMAPGFYDELAELFGGTTQDVEALVSRAKQVSYDRASLMKHSFALDEVDEAEKMFKVYRAALGHFDFMRGGQFSEMSEFSSLLEGMYDVDSMQRRAGYVVQQELAKFMENGRLSDRGTRVFGAMLQRHRRELSGVLGSGTMGQISTYTDFYFDDLIGATADLTDEQKRAHAAVLQRGITDADLEFARSQPIDDELSEVITAINQRPGYAGRAQNQASFGQAADVIEPPTGKKIFENFQFDQVRRLWDEAPLFRRGVLGAAGLVGFSAIYSKFRDRSPEDMQGPPLLPGGSAYERMPQYNMQSPLTPIQRSNGGVTYQVIADGNYDPNALQRSIGDVMAEAPIVGSFYNTQSDRIPRPRYERPRNNDELLGGI